MFHLLLSLTSTSLPAEHRQKSLMMSRACEVTGAQNPDSFPCDTETSSGLMHFQESTRNAQKGQNLRLNRASVLVAAVYQLREPLHSFPFLPHGDQSHSPTPGTWLLSPSHSPSLGVIFSPWFQPHSTTPALRNKEQTELCSCLLIFFLFLVLNQSPHLIASKWLLKPVHTEVGRVNQQPSSPRDNHT